MPDRIRREATAILEAAWWLLPTAIAAAAFAAVAVSEDDLADDPPALQTVVLPGDAENPAFVVRVPQDESQATQHAQAE